MLAASILLFGLLVLLLSTLLLNSLRKNQLQLRRLRLQVEQAKHELRTPEEKAELRRQIREIETRNAMIFGRYENAGG